MPDEPPEDDMGDPGCRDSPLVLDLGRRGFRFTSLGDGVLFDIDADGQMEQVAWTRDGVDGFLAFDRDGDGVISSGFELFGDATEQPDAQELNGFEALAVFDQVARGGNQDGFIDSNDDVFQHLMVWRDVNSDGVSQPAELQRLSHVEVARINLRYRRSERVDRHGNELRYLSRFNTSQGGQRFITDVFFVSQTLE
jgi:hypothetical protein